MGYAKGRSFFDKSQFRQPLEGAGQRCRGLFQSSGDLGDALATLTDQAHDRVRLSCVPHIVQEQTRRLIVKDPEWAQDEVTNRTIEIWVLCRQLPVSRNSSPYQASSLKSSFPVVTYVVDRILGRKDFVE